MRALQQPVVRIQNEDRLVVHFEIAAQMHSQLGQHPGQQSGTGAVHAQEQDRVIAFHHEWTLQKTKLVIGSEGAAVGKTECSAQRDSPSLP